MSLNWKDIDWEDYNARIVEHFSVHEALWLPSWRIYHIPSDEEKAEITRTAIVIEQIRIFLKAPVNVHCWIRPLSVNAPETSKHGKNYNRAAGSRASKSPHIFGRAVDFHVSGYLGPEKCSEIRQKLLPKLEVWDIRMENNIGGWIHIDTNPVVHERFFKP